MDQEKDKKLDEFFSNAMHNHDEVDFREQDWSMMEDMLNRRRKPFVMWMRVAGSVAAMLLIALGIWWLMPGNNKKEENTIARAKNTQPKQEIRERDEVPLVVDKGDSIAGLPVRGGTTAGTIHRKNSSDPAATPLNFDTVKRMLTDKDENEVVEYVAVAETGNIAVVDTNSHQESNIIAEQVADKEVKEEVQKPESDDDLRGISKRPVFAVTVLAAPDVNGVGSFSNGKAGVNAGVMLSMKLGNKFTVSTGAAYSYKPYATSFSNYRTMYQFAVNPTNVMADCRVLDIPLNVDYRFYSKQQNSLSLGAGLSSWFMLNERYNFSYPGNATGPASYSVSNQNKHILGVLNLQATYHRQLNQNVGLVLQPFMKLPLTNIGYSEVRLQSLGIAAGLTWNLSP